MVLDRDGAWVGNETDVVFERRTGRPLNRRLIGLFLGDGPTDPQGPQLSRTGQVECRPRLAFAFQEQIDEALRPGNFEQPRETIE